MVVACLHPTLARQLGVKYWVDGSAIAFCNVLQKESHLIAPNRDQMADVITSDLMGFGLRTLL